MSFEFTLLDALQALRCPVLDALAVFFDAAGAHGEIWIAFTAVLLAFRRTRRAGLAMALALGLYMLAGHCALKPLFARPRPCDLRPEMLTLVARPHGYTLPVIGLMTLGASAFAAAFALWLQNRRLGVPALVLAGFIGFTRMYLYVHFPTDILGGVALGLALGACGSLLADKISNKWAKPSEVERTV